MGAEWMESLVPLGRAVSAFGANWFVQSALLLALGLAAARAMRRRGAAHQSAVLRVALAAAIVCPLASLCLNAAGVRGLTFSLPAPHVGQTSRSVPPSSSIPPRELELAPGSVMDEMDEMDGMDEMDPALFMRDRDGAPSLVAPAFQPAPPATPGGEGEAGSAASIAAMSPLSVLYLAAAALWALISAMLLGRLAVAHARMERLRRRGRPAPETIQRELRKLAGEMGVKAPAVLAQTGIHNPCLIGLARPAILLPESGENEAGAASREVLTHELAHLLRRDCFWNLLGRLARAVLFYQPLVWVLTRRLEEAGDEVADDYVVRFGADRAGYSQCLVDLAERARPAPLEAAAGLGVVSFRSALGRRVQRILDSRRALSLSVGRGAALFILSAGVGVTLSAGLIGAGGIDDSNTARPEEVKSPSVNKESSKAGLGPEITMTTGESMSVEELIGIIEPVHENALGAIENHSAMVRARFVESPLFTQSPEQIKRDLLARNPQYAAEDYITNESITDHQVWADVTNNRYRMDTKTISRTFGGLSYPNQFEDSQELLIEDRYFQLDRKPAYGGGQKGLWVQSGSNGAMSMRGRGVFPEEFFQYGRRAYADIIRDALEAREKLGDSACQVVAEKSENGDLTAKIEYRGDRKGFEEYVFTKDNQYLISHVVRQFEQTREELTVKWGKITPDGEELHFPVLSTNIRSQKENGVWRESLRRELSIQDVQLNQLMEQAIFSLAAFDMTPEGTQVLERLAEPRNYPLSTVSLDGLMTLPLPTPEPRAEDGKSPRERAIEAEMKLIRVALESFRVDMRRYPTTEEGLEALCRIPEGMSALEYNGPYLDSANDKGLLDPFGNPYGYQSPGPSGEEYILAIDEDSRQSARSQRGETTPTPRDAGAVAPPSTSGGGRQSSYLGQNALIRYDAANSLIFSIAGPGTEKINSSGRPPMEAGQFVRLRVHRGDEEYDLDLREPRPEWGTDEIYPIIDTQVKEIAYRDRDNVWIIARVGHLGDRALLYNIAERTKTFLFGGNRFALSPDKAMIAYIRAYNIYRDNPGVAAFVNGIMFYPRIIAENEAPPEDETTIAGGNDVAEAAKRPDVAKSEWVSGMEWKTDDTIEFKVREFATLDGEGVVKTYRVTGLATNAAGSVGVERVKLSEMVDSALSTESDAVERKTDGNSAQNAISPSEGHLSNAPGEMKHDIVGEVDETLAEQGGGDSDPDAMKIKENASQGIATVAPTAVPSPRPRFTAVGTPPPPSSYMPEPVDKETLARFKEVYELKEGEILKRIPPPFIPERSVGFESEEFKTPDGMLGRRDIRRRDWIGDTRLQYDVNIRTLDGAINRMLRISRAKYDGPRDLLEMKLSGDWAVRENANEGDLITAFEKIMKEEFDRNIQFVWRKEERDVVVVSGEFSFTPLPDKEIPPKMNSSIIVTNPENVVPYVYAFSGLDDKGQRGGGSSISSMVSIFPNVFCVQMINKAKDPDLRQFSLEIAGGYDSYADYQKNPERLDRMLDVLERQTSLKFEKIRKEVDVWSIEEY